MSAFIDWNRSLVGYWSFDSYSSTHVLDNSTYGNDGEFENGIGVNDIVPGKYGSALYFDGASRVDCGNDDSLNPTDNKITLEASGTTYNKNDIIKIAENDSEIMGAIKYALKNSLTIQIKTIFVKAEIHSLNELPSFNNGRFYDEYLINLTSAFFNFDYEVDVSDFINGVLDMGAVVNYTFNLIAESGWNNTFNFILPDSVGYHRTTGIVNDNIIQWYIANNDEEIYSKIAELALKFNNPTSNFEKEDIKLEFESQCQTNYK